MSASLPPRDAHGHLCDWQLWTPEIARVLAAEEQLELDAAHWEILEFLRAHYAQFAEAPPMRLLTRAVGARLGADKGNSRYLYRLFPEGPAKQGSKLAGLPKPLSCI